MVTKSRMHAQLVVAKLTPYACHKVRAIEVAHLHRWAPRCRGLPARVRSADAVALQSTFRPSLISGVVGILPRRGGNTSTE